MIVICFSAGCDRHVDGGVSDYFCFEHAMDYALIQENKLELPKSLLMGAMVRFYRSPAEFVGIDYGMPGGDRTVKTRNLM